MSSDSPLRAWLALGAVFAVGVTATVIRPAAMPTTAGGRTGGAPSFAPAPLAAGVRPLVPAPAAVLPASPRLHRRVEPMATSVVATTSSARTSAVATTAVVEVVLQAPVTAAASEAAAPPVLPARTLETWPYPAAQVENDSDRSEARGWAPRAGGAVAVGMRAGGHGISTGWSAAGRALRRAF